MSPKHFIIVDKLQWQNDTFGTQFFHLVRIQWRFSTVSTSFSHTFICSQWTKSPVYCKNNNCEQLPMHHISSHITSWATNQVSKHESHQSCAFSVYTSFSKGMEHSHWSSPTLIDTSSGPHSMIPWLQLSHNTPVTIYMCNLNTVVSSDCMELLVCIIFLKMLGLE